MSFATRVKYIVFDFDGTIADIKPIIHLLSNQASEKFHLQDITPEKIHKARNMSPREIMVYFHIPFFLIPPLAAYVKFQQKQMIDHIPPVKGIEDLLCNLSKKTYQLGIVTSNNTETVSQFLNKHTITLFSFIHSELNLFGKHKALQNLMTGKKISSDQIIYIGDEVRDIQACKKIGIPIISVTWGFNGRRILKKHNPDYLVDKPEEIEDILAEIEKGKT